MRLLIKLIEKVQKDHHAVLRTHTQDKIRLKRDLKPKHESFRKVSEFSLVHLVAA